MSANTSMIIMPVMTVVFWGDINNANAAIGVAAANEDVDDDYDNNDDDNIDAGYN